MEALEDPQFYTAPFRINIQSFLKSHGVSVPLPGVRKVRAFLVRLRDGWTGGTPHQAPDSGRTETLLHVYEERLQEGSTPICDQCRNMGWQDHPVCNKKYHFIVPGRTVLMDPRSIPAMVVKDFALQHPARWLVRTAQVEAAHASKAVVNVGQITVEKADDEAAEYNAPASMFDSTSHYLHGVVHNNGYGHMLRINGRDGGDGPLSGGQLVALWDSLCTLLRVQAVSVEDVSNKSGMLLRLLHAVAYKKTWYGKWGYGFGRAPYNISQEEYQEALEGVHSAPLSDILQDCQGVDEELATIIYKYQHLPREDNLDLGLLLQPAPASDTGPAPPTAPAVQTLGELLQRMLRLTRSHPMPPPPPPLMSPAPSLTPLSVVTHPYDVGGGRGGRGGRPRPSVSKRLKYAPMTAPAHLGPPDTQEEDTETADHHHGAASTGATGSGRTSRKASRGRRVPLHTPLFQDSQQGEGLDGTQLAASSAAHLLLTSPPSATPPQECPPHDDFAPVRFSELMAVGRKAGTSGRLLWAANTVVRALQALACESWTSRDDILQYCTTGAWKSQGLMGEILNLMADRIVGGWAVHRWLGSKRQTYWRLQATSPNHADFFKENIMTVLTSSILHQHLQESKLKTLSDAHAGGSAGAPASEQEDQGPAEELQAQGQGEELALHAMQPQGEQCDTQQGIQWGQHDLDTVADQQPEGDAQPEDQGDRRRRKMAQVGARALLGMRAAKSASKVPAGLAVAAYLQRRGPTPSPVSSPVQPQFQEAPSSSGQRTRRPPAWQQDCIDVPAASSKAHRAPSPSPAAQPVPAEHQEAPSSSGQRARRPPAWQQDCIDVPAAGSKAHRAPSPSPAAQPVPAEHQEAPSSSGQRARRPPAWQQDCIDVPAAGSKAHRAPSPSPAAQPVPAEHQEAPSSSGQRVRRPPAWQQDCIGVSAAGSKAHRAPSPSPAAQPVPAEHQEAPSSSGQRARRPPAWQQDCIDVPAAGSKAHRAPSPSPAAQPVPAEQQEAPSSSGQRARRPPAWQQDCIDVPAAGSKAHRAPSPSPAAQPVPAEHQEAPSSSGLRARRPPAWQQDCIDVPAAGSKAHRAPSPSPAAQPVPAEHQEAPSSSGQRARRPPAWQQDCMDVPAAKSKTHKAPTSSPQSRQCPEPPSLVAPPVTAPPMPPVPPAPVPVEDPPVPTTEPHQGRSRRAHVRHNYAKLDAGEEEFQQTLAPPQSVPPAQALKQVRSQAGRKPQPTPSPSASPARRATQADPPIAGGRVSKVPAPTPSAPSKTGSSSGKASMSAAVSAAARLASPRGRVKVEPRTSEASNTAPVSPLPSPRSLYSGVPMVPVSAPPPRSPAVAPWDQQASETAPAVTPALPVVSMPASTPATATKTFSRRVKREPTTDGPGTDAATQQHQAHPGQQPECTAAAQHPVNLGAQLDRQEPQCEQPQEQQAPQQQQCEADAGCQSSKAQAAAATGHRAKVRRGRKGQPAAEPVAGQELQPAEVAAAEFQPMEAATVEQQPAEAVAVELQPAEPVPVSATDGPAPTIKPASSGELPVMPTGHRTSSRRARKTVLTLEQEAAAQEAAAQDAAAQGAAANPLPPARGRRGGAKRAKTEPAAAAAPGDAGQEGMARACAPTSATEQHQDTQNHSTPVSAKSGRKRAAADATAQDSGKRPKAADCDQQPDGSAAAESGPAEPVGVADAEMGGADMKTDTAAVQTRLSAAAPEAGSPAAHHVRIGAPVPDLGASAAGLDSGVGAATAPHLGVSSHEGTAPCGTSWRVPMICVMGPAEVVPPVVVQPHPDDPVVPVVQSPQAPQGRGARRRGAAGQAAALRAAQRQTVQAQLAGDAAELVPEGQQPGVWGADMVSVLHGVSGQNGKRAAWNKGLKRGQPPRSKQGHSGEARPDTISEYSHAMACAAESADAQGLDAGGGEGQQPTESVAAPGKSGMSVALGVLQQAYAAARSAGRSNRVRGVGGSRRRGNGRISAGEDTEGGVQGAWNQQTECAEPTLVGGLQAFADGNMQAEAAAIIAAAMSALNANTVGDAAQPAGELLGPQHAAGRRAARGGQVQTELNRRKRRVSQSTSLTQSGGAGDSGPVMAVAEVHEDGMATLRALGAPLREPVSTAPRFLRVPLWYVKAAQGQEGGGPDPAVAWWADGSVLGVTTGPSGQPQNLLPAPPQHQSAAAAAGEADLMQLLTQPAEPAQPGGDIAEAATVATEHGGSSDVAGGSEAEHADRQLVQAVVAEVVRRVLASDSQLAAAESLPASRTTAVEQSTVEQSAPSTGALVATPGSALALLTELLQSQCQAHLSAFTCSAQVPATPAPPPRSHATFSPVAAMVLKDLQTLYNKLLRCYWPAVEAIRCGHEAARQQQLQEEECKGCGKEVALTWPQAQVYVDNAPLKLRHMPGYLQILRDSKYFVKTYGGVMQYAGSLPEDHVCLMCQAHLPDSMVSRWDPPAALSHIPPVVRRHWGYTPPEPVLVPVRANEAEVKKLCGDALSEVYRMFKPRASQFRVTQVEEGWPEDLTTTAHGHRLVVQGMGIDSDPRWRQAGGQENWHVCCGACGTQDDDGERMIACDVCSIWCHTRCYGIQDGQEDPNRFVCDACLASLSQPAVEQPPLVAADTLQMVASGPGPQGAAEPVVAEDAQMEAQGTAPQEHADAGLGDGEGLQAAADRGFPEMPLDLVAEGVMCDDSATEDMEF